MIVTPAPTGKSHSKRPCLTFACLLAPSDPTNTFKTPCGGKRPKSGPSPAPECPLHDRAVTSSGPQGLCACLSPSFLGLLASLCPAFAGHPCLLLLQSLCCICYMCKLQQWLFERYEKLVQKGGDQSREGAAGRCTTPQCLLLCLLCCPAVPGLLQRGGCTKPPPAASFATVNAGVSFPSCSHLPLPPRPPHSHARTGGPGCPLASAAPPGQPLPLLQVSHQPHHTTAYHITPHSHACCELPRAKAGPHGLRRNAARQHAAPHICQPGGGLVSICGIRRGPQALGNSGGPRPHAVDGVDGVDEFAPGAGLAA